MSSSKIWQTLLDNVEEVADDATLITPLTRAPFRVTDLQEHHIAVEFENEDEKRTLHREQFETLYRNVTGAPGGFDFDRLPPNAEPYAAVLSLHPDCEVNESAGMLDETDTPSSSPLLEAPSQSARREEDESQTEPSIAEMLDNMGDPSEVVCPIEGCRYSHRSASSVARHVSGSSTAKHIWENTSYAGWRDFVREHGESPG
ncbi:hypothetical protein [Halorientalis pallida]|uniref:Uncharacterized protein n=1 Tax=Halorientalis pallida TaxID=2479928 RepID=A0A498L0F3_9EURY|nr:hypothetical protein [Halorientalis pallida]RXK51527.1 hypothetical protein EAF64_02515 [Halorientalis pallida]